MAVDEATTGGPGDSSAPRYHIGRPGDNRRSTPWHRDRHHIDVLPARLRALSMRLPVSADGRILDYGCAEVPYRRFFGDQVEYVAADLAGNPAATLELNADGTVPVDSATFDAVLSTQVLEHVTDPQRYLSEAYRVLRPGGEMLLSTHGIFIYHPDPVDLWRWTSAGLRHAVELEGFEVTHFEGMVGLVPTGLQLVQDGIYWHLPPRLRPLFALVMQALIKATDKLHGPESRAMNAQTYALIARKPHD